MFMKFIVLILFYPCNTAAHEDALINSDIDNDEKLQMKVNGEYLTNVKYNDDNTDIRSQYLYEEKALNITCEAVNFKHDMWLDLLTIDVNNGKTNHFLPNNYLLNSITISYQPSSNYDLKCTTRTIFPHPNVYSYILEFKKKTTKETSCGEEPSSIVNMFISVLVVVTILTIIIILIKIIKWWKKKNNQKNNGSDLLSVHMTPESKKTFKESHVNTNNCTPYAITGIIYSVPTKQKQNYVNINKTTKNCDNGNNYVNQNNYVSTDKEEWLSNSAYETLSNLYCEAK